MNQTTKNFSFKEESSKCILHQEPIRFICQCNQKFCVRCISDIKEIESHFKSHKDFKLFQLKDLKSFYLNQTEQIENILAEIYEGRKKSENGENLGLRKNFINENFAFTELKTNLLNLLNFEVENFLYSIFEKEQIIVQEMVEIANLNDITLDSKGIINSIIKLINLKEKGKLSLIGTYDKINLLQNVFLLKIENFVGDFKNLLTKYFTQEKEKQELNEMNFNDEKQMQDSIIPYEDKENDFSYLINDRKQLSGIKEEVKVGNQSVEFLISHKSISDIEKSVKEKKSESKFKNPLILNLNINLSKSATKEKDYKLYNLEDIPDSNISKHSNFHTITNFGEDANIFSNSNSKNLKSTSLWKEGIIPEISNSIENLSYFMKSNQIKQKENSNSSINYDKQSLITEFNLNINKENRNRINKIIFYKKQRRFENILRHDTAKMNKKTKQFLRNAGQLTPVNFNNQNPAYGIPAKGFKIFSQPPINQENTYYNFNHFGSQVEIDKYPGNNNLINTNNNKASTIKKLCVDCYTPFSVKTSNNWRKRCTPCQKTFFEKINNIKSFYSVNSYKAGKMNQVCSKCKNTFIVPVALAKQRKTCYYCFKSSLNN